MQHSETPTWNWRRPWARVRDRKRASLRTVTPDPAAAERTLLPNEIDDPLGESARRFIEPGLRQEERLEAEREARQGLPATTAATPSDGELRLRERFLTALARLRWNGDGAFETLDRAHDQACHRAQGIAADTRVVRDPIRSLTRPPLFRNAPVVRFG